MFALASARVSPAPVARLPTRRVAPAARRVYVRAEKAEIDTEKILADLSEKWEKTEDKTSVIVYTTGAFAALWFSSTIIGAVNHLPLLPKVLELVGLGYSAWFVYRYLLFKTSRQELLADIEELKKKVAGSE